MKMRIRRKNKAHKSNGRRGRRHRKTHEGGTPIQRKITKTRTGVKPIRVPITDPATPTLVSILPLNQAANCERLRSIILEICRRPKSMEVEEESTGMKTVLLPGHKKRKWTMFPVLKTNNSLEIVQTLFSTELVLFVLDEASVETPIDETGQLLLTLFKSSGLCSFMVILQSTNTSFKKRVTKEFENQFGNEVKVLTINDKKDCLSMLHHLQPDSLKVPCWRQERPFLIPESISQNPDSNNSTLFSITGILRSKPLSIQQIISISDIGYFQIHQIEEQDSGRILVADPSLQQSIKIENEPPELEFGKQDFQDTVENEVKTVPKGTSDYQATWVADLDEKSEGSDSGSDSEASMDAESEGLSWSEQMELDEDPLEDPRLPEEVKTSPEQPARIRFQNYRSTEKPVAPKVSFRGLKSFRTSPWDAKIDLPMDYSRIFEFEDFRNAMKKSKKEVSHFDHTSDVSVGSRITLTLKGVTSDQIQSFKDKFDRFEGGLGGPMLVFGLMRDETKLSIQHYRVKKVPEYQAPIQSNEPFLMITPFHSSKAQPLFSTDNPQDDKHKLERILEPSHHSIASFYGPIRFPPMPLLAFKEANGIQLAFTGSLQSCAPDRIILKHVILTGRPTKAYKKRAVVKGMFHDPDDVRWFKPLELWTKCGRTGYIKESLGTKGLMKCYFDGNIQHHDTVCISLYKRVFPVWLE